MKWRLAAEELREKSLIQENLLTLFYEDLKSTEKMLLSIANSIHNPELIPDILNPTKLSVNFNEGKNQKRNPQNGTSMYFHY